MKGKKKKESAFGGHVRSILRRRRKGRKEGERTSLVLDYLVRKGETTDRSLNCGLREGGKK